MGDKEIQNIIRAIIQAATKPVLIEELFQAFKEQNEVETIQIQEAIERLLKTEDPVQELKEVAGGYRYQIKQKYVPWILKKSEEEIEADPLPKALLETLAIIAYSQPISRGEADLIRARNTSWAVFEQLEERGWIKVVAYGGEHKRTALYGTTLEFLEYFGLNSIQDLPNLEAMVLEEKML